MAESRLQHLDVRDSQCDQLHESRGVTERVLAASVTRSVEYRE